MFLQLENFPSKGRGVNFTEINIDPLTMRDILQFQAEYNVPNLAWVSKLYILITHFLLRNNQAMSMPVTDLYILLAYTSYLSTTQEYSKRYQLEFNCPKCGKKQVGQITLHDLQFDSLDEKFHRLESIVIGDTKYFVRIPTIREFYDVLGRYKHLPLQENAAKVLFLASFLRDKDGISEFYEKLNNATLSDIALIDYLFVNLCIPLKPTKIICTKCKGGAVSCDLMEKLTDMFRLISLNSTFDKNKITFV